MCFLCLRKLKTNEFCTNLEHCRSDYTATVFGVPGLGSDAHDQFLCQFLSLSLSLSASWPTTMSFQSFTSIAYSIEARMHMSSTSLGIPSSFRTPRLIRFSSLNLQSPVCCRSGRQDVCTRYIQESHCLDRDISRNSHHKRQVLQLLWHTIRVGSYTCAMALG